MEKEIAMSQQQRRFSAGGGFSEYRALITEDRSLLFFLGFEFYSLLLSNLSSFIGLGCRQLSLPFFLRSAGRAPIIGRSVTIRQPHRIGIGDKVILDDFVTLDVRAHESRNSEIGISLADHVLLGRNSIVVAKDGFIRLGRACNVGSHCRIATQSSVEIGESVLIAAYSYIGPGNHKIDGADQPLIERGMDLKGGVRIGDNVWIGTRATILDGVTIGRDAVVGAHSLVLEDVPERAIVAGAPAKVIRYRD
jgi:acetyltransferase-like isoleucine patch superfamily enzyme